MQIPNSFIPLVSPKAFGDFSPDEYLTYIRSLYVAPAVKEPPAEVRASLTKKGTLTVRITRAEKYLLRSEVEKIAKDLMRPQQEIWNAIRKRKIEIRAK